MLIVLEGPMPERTYKRGMKNVTFKKGEPVEVEDEFGAELLGENKNGLTVAEAAPYCVPVFREVSTAAKGGAGKKARASGGGEEVNG